MRPNVTAFDRPRFGAPIREEVPVPVPGRPQALASRVRVPWAIDPLRWFLLAFSAHRWDVVQW